MSATWGISLGIYLDYYYATRTVLRSAESHSVKKNKGKRSHINSQNKFGDTVQHLNSDSTSSVFTAAQHFSSCAVRAVGVTNMIWCIMHQEESIISAESNVKTRVEHINNKVLEQHLTLATSFFFACLLADIEIKIFNWMHRKCEQIWQRLVWHEEVNEELQCSVRVWY